MECTDACIVYVETKLALVFLAVVKIIALPGLPSPIYPPQST